MASSFPKMLKSSASFSQSIRNRLRLKNFRAQAKNFYRVLDIRVPEIVKSDLLAVGPFQYGGQPLADGSGISGRVIVQRRREDPYRAYFGFIVIQHR